MLWGCSRGHWGCSGDMTSDCFVDFGLTLILNHIVTNRRLQSVTFHVRTADSDLDSDSDQDSDSDLDSGSVSYSDSFGLISFTIML